MRELHSLAAKGPNSLWTATHDLVRMRSGGLS
jgi:hypothetical protein